MNNPSDTSASQSNGQTHGYDGIDNSNQIQANQTSSSHRHSRYHDHPRIHTEDECSIVAAQIDVQAVRSQFPFFSANPETIPFNNAATTLLPGTTIELVSSYLRSEIANPGRGALDTFSTKLAARLAEARVRTAAFIEANPADIAFTSGATASLNLVALAWGLKNLRNGDEIMVCLEDHRSTVLPWLNLQTMLGQLGTNIVIVPFTLHQMGNYELVHIEAAKTDRTRLIAMTHVHHIYGLNMEVNIVREIVGSDVLISLDASQSVGHCHVHLDHLPVDFISFSGHKMMALPGIGVLWTSPERQAELWSPVVGGGMTETASQLDLSLDSSTLAAILEAGTPNIPAILSMVPAIEFIESIGLDVIQSRIKELMKRLYLGLKQLPNIEFSPGADFCWHQSHGILSFRVNGARTADIAFLLSDANILVRAGDHCAHKKPDGDDYVRVSLHIYNSEEEVDRFIETLAATL